MLYSYRRFIFVASRLQQSTAMCILVTILVLTLISVVQCHDSCPTNCTCDSSVQQVLRVDCQRRTAPVTDDSKLSTQLESFLANRIADNLTRLSITNTAMYAVPQSVCRMKTLQVVSMDHNRLTSLPDHCFGKMKSLTSIYASYNNITELQDGLFDGLQQLRVIKMEHNRIASIGLRTFSNPSDLLNLRTIQLCHNILTSLEPWPIIRGLAGSMEQSVSVDISSNLVSTFTNALNWTTYCGMKSFVTIDLGQNQIQHVTDLTRGFGIGLTEYICFMNFLQPPEDVAHQFSRIKVALNPFNCDCIDYDMLKFYAAYKKAGLFRDSYCNLPPNLYLQEIPRIPLTQFVCDVTDKCPSGCQCTYRPANATMDVDCSRGNLSTLPNLLPTLPKSYTKYKLGFSHNINMRRIEYKKYFNNTALLDISKSGLEEIDADVWSNLLHIPTVLLHGNQLTSLPVALTNFSISSDKIDLSDNPWRCNCDDGWMASWLNSIVDRLVNADGTMCFSPTKLRGKNILLMGIAEFCPVSDGQPAVLIVVSVLGGCSAVLLVTCLAFYCFRLWLFTRWKFHPFDRDECNGEDLDNDVFLCCSSDDHQSHGLHILKQLEDKGYRVCYHLRDFVGGIAINENIITAIVRSKRTVCLLSENFLQSAHCMHEFTIALHHSITVKHSRRLIVLMAMDISTYSSESSDDRMSAVATNRDLTVLRQYLRQYTYIDYRKRNWLDKLLYALPLTGMNDYTSSQSNVKQEQDGGDDVCLLSY